MSARIESSEIKQRLTEQLEGVLDQFFPGWVKQGNSAFPAFVSKADPGSFEVYLADTRHGRRGEWYRRSAGIGGDVLNLLAYGLTGSHKADARTFEEAKRFLGVSDHEPTAEERAEWGRRRAAEERRAQQRAQDDARDRSRRQEIWLRIWSDCLPIENTRAEHYLNFRGILRPPSGWPPVLAFHRGLKHPEGPTFPCLVALAQNVAGTPCGIWRIFIDPELSPATKGKAPVEKAKLGLGDVHGAAVRIGGDGAPVHGGHGLRIGVAEGVETALAAWTLGRYRVPVWAGLSTSGVAGLEVPLSVERVLIYPDGDRPKRQRNGDILSPPGMRAATALRDRLTTAGISNEIVDPPGGADFLDVLKSMREHEGAL